MRIKHLNNKFIAVAIDRYVYAELTVEYLKNKDENIPITLNALNGYGFKKKDIIECATEDEWINHINETINKQPFKYTDVLDIKISNLNITKYLNYNKFTGINKTKDCGDVHMLFGSAPSEEFTSALMSKQEYDYRRKDSYISPIESFHSLYMYLNEPDYILILIQNE